LVQVDPLVVATAVLESLPSFVISAGAWWISRRIALTRNSQGLKLMSHGILAKLGIDGLWYAIWWVYFGGIYEVVIMIGRGMNETQISWTLYFQSISDEVVGAVSLSVMSILMVYGARLIFRGDRRATSL